MNFNIFIYIKQIKIWFIYKNNGILIQTADSAEDHRIKYIEQGDYNMLGEQVRNIRKSRGFTLKALAEQTGLSIGYISQIERNLTDPSLSTLRKISAALDVPTYLFMGEAEANNTLTTRKNQVITLSQGDSTLIRSNLPHIVENTTDKQMTGISVFTPAIWFPSIRRTEQNGLNSSL